VFLKGNPAKELGRRVRKPYPGTIKDATKKVAGSAAENESKDERLREEVYTELLARFGVKGVGLGRTFI